MSKKELRSVLNFVKERGVVHETEIWKQFVQSDDVFERRRVQTLIEQLNYKGLIQHGYNDQGHCVVKYAMNSYQ